jgi:hypothetical protein
VELARVELVREDVERVGVFTEVGNIEDGLGMGEI